MQKIKNKSVKFILLFPFDLINTFIGIIYFKLFKNTKNFFYQSMVRLFCITGGWSNKFINDLTSRKKISNKIGSNIKLEYIHDPNLIGGLILKIESLMIDTSIKNKLKILENKLLEA